MAQKINLTASVGRQRVTALTPGNESNYAGSIRDAMKAITGKYEKLINGLEGASAGILLDALKPTFALSQKYCPKDTRALVNSGFLETTGQGKGSRVVIGYAKGGKPHYAAFVHELTHLRHASPTRSKFLLTALEQDARGIQQRIVRGYKSAVGIT